MKDGLVLDVSSERVNQSKLQVNGNSYTSTITFSPLNSTDAGNYTCTGTISPIGSGCDADIESYIIGSSSNGSYTLTVQGMYMYVQHILYVNNEDHSYIALVFALLHTLFICFVIVENHNSYSQPYLVLFEIWV